MDGPSLSHRQFTLGVPDHSSPRSRPSCVSSGPPSPLSLAGRTLCLIFHLETQDHSEEIRPSHQSLHAQVEGFVPRALLVAESLTMSTDRTIVTADLHVSRKAPESSIMGLSARPACWSKEMAFGVRISIQKCLRGGAPYVSLLLLWHWDNISGLSDLKWLNLHLVTQLRGNPL